ncbi:MAG: DUF362 domain-containing protein [Deltaproteobacteria bacterium]|nr:DUF362 domain-containing protein [Deltaproteobacteria bacterium]
MGRHPVYIWNVEGYDVDRIREVVGRSMDEMGLRLGKRVLVKHNTVISHPTLFRHAFTRSEFLDGVLGALTSRVSSETMEIAVGERCGITIPTRFAFRNAGYLPVIEKHQAKTYYFEEERPTEVRLRGKERLRDAIYTPEPMVRTDFLVNCPKFKSHPWTGVTFALKNFIGIQDDAHRLVDHDFALNEKIADLQEIVSPSLIAIDAVIGGMGRMLVPEPVTLNLVICGVNPVAVDATCCRIAGIDPESIDHVRICSERGLGPLDEASIDVRGDVELEEAQDRARAITNPMTPVSRFFEATSLKARAGPPPDEKGSDYCWGGCPGCVQEAIDIHKAFTPDVYQRIQPMHLVYGDCRGQDITTRRGERVMFFGDCVRFDGKINGKRVVIESSYVERHRKDTHTIRAEDLVHKTIKSYVTAFLAWPRSWVHVKGCPVSVAEHVLMMAIFGRIKNVYFDPRVVFMFGWTWLVSNGVRLGRWLTGRLGRKRLPARSH